MFGNNIIVLKQLQLMLASGMSFEESMQQLIRTYPQRYQIKTVVHHLNRGYLYVYALSFICPWWCPYPFKDSSVTIDVQSFLTSYLSYIESKKVYLNKMFMAMRYPIILCCFSFAVLLFSMVYLIPMMQSFSSEGISHLHQRIHMMIGIIVLVVFGVVLGIIYLMIGLFSVNNVDIFEIVSICLSQGWSMGLLFQQLKFNSKIDKKWAFIFYDMVESGSFSMAFSHHLKVPVIISASLKAYEMSSDLVNGFHNIKQEYQKLFFSNIELKIKGIQYVLYVIIVCLLLLILYIMYWPMINLGAMSGFGR